MRMMRGDRIGLIGPNGIGKSTLLNILLGKLTPTQGKITLGTQLEIIYFDQLRQALDLEKTVTENVVQGSDFVEINGKKQHIISYLADFLFTPARARTPVKALSGGECNRLLLARLFSEPANLIVMDEPTNDLDLETLELLEELLCHYQGSLLLVSHDRSFLDNVVTSTLVFEGHGVIKDYVGGYHDWLQQTNAATTATKSKIQSAKPAELTPQKKSIKLSYKEQKELSDLPMRIEKLEAEHQTLQKIIATTEFYQQEPGAIKQIMEKLKQLSVELECAYQRWTELEKK